MGDAAGFLPSPLARQDLGIREGSLEERGESRGKMQRQLCVCVKRLWEGECSSPESYVWVSLEVCTVNWSDCFYVPLYPSIYNFNSGKNVHT